MMLISLAVTTAFAADTTEDFSVEVSLDELKNGVTVVLEDKGNGDYVVRQLSNVEAYNLENGRTNYKIKATFHCGLK